MQKHYNFISLKQRRGVVLLLKLRFLVQSCVPSGAARRSAGGLSDGPTRRFMTEIS
jgi:hypothetical protein